MDICVFLLVSPTSKSTCETGEATRRAEGRFRSRDNVEERRESREERGIKTDL